LVDKREAAGVMPVAFLFLADFQNGLRLAGWKDDEA
jgi:hypothetical protein